MCTVYDVNNRDATGAAKIVRELAGYEGFLSSCRFLDDNKILTGSGDMKMYVQCFFKLLQSVEKGSLLFSIFFFKFYRHSEIWITF